MRGTGRTVFSGNKIEDFQVEILGVLDNIGPKESLILARLSGGPLEHTGVMQGMSGSPVYIDGKLVGAVAMAFPFAKDPIAGIRPIEAMLRTSTAATPPSPSPAPAASSRAALALNERDLTRRIPRPEPALGGEARMIDIATPLSFGGFSRATLDAFAPQLRTLGLEPRQGVTSGGKIEPGMGNAADLKPGAMISVQLMAGDLSVGADGTVTHIVGNRIYAFGHRFLNIGSTALPFARAEVLTLLANTNTSFKISSAKEWMGTIYQDRNTAVAGVSNRRDDGGAAIKLILDSVGLLIFFDFPGLSPLFFQFDEGDARRVADRGVLACEGEAPGGAIHAEDCDVVAPLVATVEELTRGIEGETPRIITACPFLPDVLHTTNAIDREDRNAVVQTVAGVEKLSVARDEDLGAEVAPGEPRRQRGDRLLGGHRAGLVIKSHDGRSFFLNRKEP